MFVGSAVSVPQQVGIRPMWNDMILGSAVRCVRAGRY